MKPKLPQLYITLLSANEWLQNKTRCRKRNWILRWNHATLFVGSRPPTPVIQPPLCPILSTLISSFSAISPPKIQIFYPYPSAPCPHPFFIKSPPTIAHHQHPPTGPLSSPTKLFVMFFSVIIKLGPIPYFPDMSGWTSGLIFSEKVWFFPDIDLGTSGGDFENYA